MATNVTIPLKPNKRNMGGISKLKKSGKLPLKGQKNCLNNSKTEFAT